VASLGSKKHPAVARVKTEERAQELLEQFTARGKHIIIELTPDQPEYVASSERALSQAQPSTAVPKIGRNEPCPCGSGKKFKKCCLGSRTPPEP
jgi:SWIM/SEC-C metal-binding protein